MSFLTAEKKDHVARCPARGGGRGKTYMGNARLKTFFFHLDAFPKAKLLFLCSIQDIISFLMVI